MITGTSKSHFAAPGAVKLGVSARLSPKSETLGRSAALFTCSEKPSTPLNAPIPCVSIIFLAASITSIVLAVVNFAALSAYSGKDLTTEITPSIVPFDIWQMYLRGLRTIL